MTASSSQLVATLCAAIAALACLIVLLRVLRSSRSQTEALFLQTRQNHRPVLLCTALRTLDDNRRLATITNQSDGVALNIFWSDDDQEPSAGHRTNGPSLVLGPRATLDLAFLAARTTRLLFVYNSIFEERARTEVLIIDDLYSNRYFAESMP